MSPRVLSNQIIFSTKVQGKLSYQLLVWSSHCLAFHVLLGDELMNAVKGNRPVDLDCLMRCSDGIKESYREVKVALKEIVEYQLWLPVEKRKKISIL